jgi:hypothetical protein
MTESQGFDPFGHFGVVAARKAEPGKVTLNIRHKDGDSQAAELLRQDPERHGFPRAGGSGNKAMAIGHPGENADNMLPLSNRHEIRRISHLSPSWKNSILIATDRKSILLDS